MNVSHSTMSLYYPTNKLQYEGSCIIFCVLCIYVDWGIFEAKKTWHEKNILFILFLTTTSSAIGHFLSIHELFFFKIFNLLTDYRYKSNFHNSNIQISELQDNCTKITDLFIARKCCQKYKNSYYGDVEIGENRSGFLSLVFAVLFCNVFHRVFIPYMHVSNTNLVIPSSL